MSEENQINFSVIVIIITSVKMVVHLRIIGEK